MEREYCLYKYVDRTTGVPVYVGQSQGRLAKGMGVEQRISDHRQDKKFAPHLDTTDIYVTYLENPAEVNAYETALINLYKPVLNVSMKYDGVSAATAKCFRDCFEWIPFQKYLDQKKKILYKPEQHPAADKKKKEKKEKTFVETCSYQDYLYNSLYYTAKLEIISNQSKETFEHNLGSYKALWECYHHIKQNGLVDITKSCYVSDDEYPDVTLCSIDIANHYRTGFISIINSASYDRSKHLLSLHLYENMICDHNFASVDELLYHIKQNLIAWKKLLPQYHVGENYHKKTKYVIPEIPEYDVESLCDQSDAEYEKRAWEIGNEENNKPAKRKPKKADDSRWIIKSKDDELNFEDAITDYKEYWNFYHQVKANGLHDYIREYTPNEFVGNMYLKLYHTKGIISFHIIGQFYEYDESHIQFRFDEGFCDGIQRLMKCDSEKVCNIVLYYTVLSLQYIRFRLMSAVVDETYAKSKGYVLPEIPDYDLSSLYKGEDLDPEYTSWFIKRYY